AAMSTGPDGGWTNTRLVEECLRGSELAWHVLLDRYKSLIYSIPVRYGAPPQDAADIFQAVCLDLFNELPRLRDANALQSWLIRVTTNKCYHWKRRQTTQNGACNEDELENLSGSEPIPPEVIAQIQQEQMLRESIAVLPG